MMLPEWRPAASLKNITGAGVGDLQNFAVGYQGCSRYANKIMAIRWRRITILLKRPAVFSH